MPREEGQRDAAAWGSIQRDPVTFIHFISAARNRKIDRESGRGRGRAREPLESANVHFNCEMANSSVGQVRKGREDASSGRKMKCVGKYASQLCEY